MLSEKSIWEEVESPKGILVFARTRKKEEGGPGQFEGEAKVVLWETMMIIAIQKRL